MSERAHMLPNGVVIRVRDRVQIDLKFTEKDAWISLTQDPRDSRILAAFLAIELEPAARR